MAIGTVFVTGGNGFIGSVVVRKLLDKGYRVRCLLRASSSTQRLSGLSYDTAPGDVRDAASIQRGAAGCKAIIHLASLSSWDAIDSPEMRDVVVQGTQNVLDAAQQVQARVVFVSSLTAIDGTQTPEILSENSEYSLHGKTGLKYSQAKNDAEALCKTAAQNGAQVVIVNPAEVYGPDDTGFITAGNLIDFAKSSPVLVCNGGTSVVHIDDVAAGIIAAMEKGRSGERYILGGDNLTLKELTSLSLRLMNKQHSVITLPNAVIRGLTKTATTLRIPLPYNPKVIPYATRYWFADNSKAKRELNAEFRSAEEVLAPTISWLKEAGHIA